MCAMYFGDQKINPWISFWKTFLHLKWCRALNVKEIIEVMGKSFIYKREAILEMKCLKTFLLIIFHINKPFSNWLFLLSSWHTCELVQMQCTAHNTSPHNSLCHELSSFHPFPSTWVAHHYHHGNRLRCVMCQNLHKYLPSARCTCQPRQSACELAEECYGLFLGRRCNPILK